MEAYENVIIGAGPYGLSMAAHLKQAGAGDVHVFGKSMVFWEEMPVGMLLRSPLAASSLADPKSALTLQAFRTAHHLERTSPLPLNQFVAYGKWFQKQIVRDLDSRQINCVQKDEKGFRLLGDDGETIHARRLIVACGIGPFPHIPEEFRALPQSLLRHSSALRDPGQFTGRRVVVIGAGQSALESAALLHEAGAEVEVLVRQPEVNWLGKRPWLRVPPLGSILYAWPDVGSAGVSHLVARPNLFRLLPRQTQDRLGPYSVRAGGAKWLVSRMQSVPISVSTFVTAAARVGDQVSLSINNGGKRLVDHVLLGTGYRLDIAKYQFLSRELVHAVRQVNGYPVLDSGFETDVPGLHFVGASAAWSFGPLMRFVAGAGFAARSVANRIYRADYRRAS